MLMQIDAGAEVIITQPPLLWDRFEAWMNRVQQWVLCTAVIPPSDTHNIFIVAHQQVLDQLDMSIAVQSSSMTVQLDFCVRRLCVQAANAW